MNDLGPPAAAEAWRVRPLLERAGGAMSSLCPFSIMSPSGSASMGLQEWRCVCVFGSVVCAIHRGTRANAHTLTDTHTHTHTHLRCTHMQAYASIHTPRVLLAVRSALPIRVLALVLVLVSIALAALVPAALFVLAVFVSAALAPVRTALAPVMLSLCLTTICCWLLLILGLLELWLQQLVLLLALQQQLLQLAPVVSAGQRESRIKLINCPESADALSVPAQLVFACKRVCEWACTPHHTSTACLLRVCESVYTRSSEVDPVDG